MRIGREDSLLLWILTNPEKRLGKWHQHVACEDSRDRALSIDPLSWPHPGSSLPDFGPNCSGMCAGRLQAPLKLVKYGPPLPKTAGEHLARFAWGFQDSADGWEVSNVAPEQPASPDGNEVKS